MSSSLHLSRVRLRAARGEALSSIAPILFPDEPAERTSHAHRLVWLLFQDQPDAKRDFLWRAEDVGRFLILSSRPPQDRNGLFDVETKPFEPQLSKGDRLRFVLRANPIRRLDQSETRTTAKGRETPKRKKVDVVMHALREVPRTDWEKRTGRAFERDRIAQEAVAQWFDAQGEENGFQRDDDAPFKVNNYTQLPIERRRGRSAGISVVDIEGLIEVTDPTRLLARLPVGFGSAKAFGCGLMLIRRG